MTAWIVVLAASLAMPVLGRGLIVTVPAAAQLLKIERVRDVLTSPYLQAVVPALSPQIAESGEAPPPGMAPPARFDWWSVATALYLIVAGVMLFRLLIGLVLTWRVRHAAQPVRGPWTAGSDVRKSSDVTAPFTFGATILVPADFAEWSAVKRRAAMSHERSHVARGDFYVLRVADLNRCLFWFSPLPWWLARSLKELAEFLSDDAAIGAVGNRHSYAKSLLHVASLVGRLPAALPMARPHTVCSRIERILAATGLPTRIGWHKRASFAAALVPVVAICAVTVAPSGSPSGAAAQNAPEAAGTDEPPVIDAPACKVAGIERARKEAQGFAEKEDEVRRHLAVDLPTVTVRTVEKSFDFVGTGMRITNVLGVKMHVPQFWRKTVKFDLPAIETTMKRLDIYLDTPSRTRQTGMLLTDVAALAESEQGALAEINRAEASALAPLEQERTHLLADKDRARGQLAEIQKENEAEAAYAPALKILDEALSKTKAEFADQRLNASKQLAKLQDHYLNDRLATGSCGAVRYD